MTKSDDAQNSQIANIVADFYKGNPQGLINDRFDLEHADFVTPEYKSLDGISHEMVCDRAVPLPHAARHAVSCGSGKAAVELGSRSATTARKGRSTC